MKFSIFCGYFSDFALKNTICADRIAREGFSGAPQLCCGAPFSKGLLLFLAALVVDDGEGGFVDERDALLLGDIHHLLQGGL